MKNFLSLFFMSLACVPLSVVAQTADDEATEATTYQFEQVETICNPKAYIHVKIEPGATALYSDAGSKFTRATLRNASALSYIEDGSEVETQLPYTRFFADYDLANGVITYFVYDNLYIPSKSTIKLTLPVVCAKYADDVVRTYNGETISLTVADAVYLSESCNSSSVTVDKNQTLIIKKSSVLTVDNDLEIANLIVEAGDESSYGAGVIVNNGASLAIADTAYFLCHNKFHRNNPYLINNGSYTAAASIFTKSLDNRLNLEYATKYGYLNNGSLSKVDYVTPTISFPVSDPKKTFCFEPVNRWSRINQQNIRFFAGSSAVRYYYLDNDKSYPLFEADIYPYSQKNFETYSKNNFIEDELVFRANGQINDEFERQEEIVTEYKSTITGSTFAQLNNPYQACIDWSAIVEDNPDYITTLRNVTVGSGRFNMSWSYHLLTGLTTYDGPMQFGYLQPVMSPAHFYSLGKSTVDDKGNLQIDVPSDIYAKIGKKYLTSYKDIESKVPVVTVPYIRFYVDDPNCPKGVGNRSVYVAYFLPSEDYVHVDEDYYNPIMCVNKLLDVQNDYENAYDINGIGCRCIFPYVGYHANLDIFARVRVWPLPSINEQFNLERFMTIAVDKSQKSVELGILDYGNFDGLTFQYGSLVLDTRNPSNNVTKVTLSLDENVDANFVIKSQNRQYLSHPAYHVEPSDEAVVYISNFAKLPSSVNDVVDFASADVRVTSEVGKIVVASQDKSHIRIFNANGVLISSTDVEGSASVNVERGLYVVNASNSKGNTAVKVLVE
ncbi:MAG: T9SS type A sorting domain-containing protein [Bacteroidales bacterium]|nr:T9SS type A sorting domain-containing protein [Bacteroidales bacterium]